VSIPEGGLLALSRRKWQNRMTLVHWLVIAVLEAEMFDACAYQA
jgi:cytochrome b